jgi:membrane protein involved in colicin uptake
MANGGRTKVVVASVVAAIVLVAAGIGLLLKNNHDTDVRNASIASSSSSKAAADDAAAAASAAAAAEADRVQTARAKRAADIKGIEASVKTMAEKHVADGLFDGPVLSVSCDPVGGGSTDDLTAKTTVFECFAATKDNGDGTMTGHKYHATMNWDTENYTYGLGEVH